MFGLMYSENKLLQHYVTAGAMTDHSQHSSFSCCSHTPGNEEPSPLC